MSRRSLETGGAAAAHLDAAIDALLDGRPQRTPADQREVLELLPTARLLHEVLPRFQPRFRFEERLAIRLRAGGGDVVPFPAAVPGEATPPGTVRRRGLIAGGAIASGLSLVVPLAGAVMVAWRRSRPTGGI